MPTKAEVDSGKTFSEQKSVLRPDPALGRGVTNSDPSSYRRRGGPTVMVPRDQRPPRGFHHSQRVGSS